MISGLPSSSAPTPLTYDRQTQTAADAPSARAGLAKTREAQGADDPTSGQQARAGARSTRLSEADQQRVRELQQRDREVRAHELAHVAAGAGLILRGASFTYETGPDGQRYAIGGEVTIDTSPGRTPEETLSKASRVKAAALAPADPSPQDMQVAGKADMMAAEARAELTQQTRAESSGEGASSAAAQARPDSADASSGDGTAARRMRIAYNDAAIAGSGLRDQSFSAYA